MLAAAIPALNRAGEGSSPSGPTLSSEPANDVDRDAGKDEHPDNESAQQCDVLRPTDAAFAFPNPVNDGTQHLCEDHRSECTNGEIKRVSHDAFSIRNRMVGPDNEHWSSSGQDSAPVMR